MTNRNITCTTNTHENTINNTIFWVSFERKTSALTVYEIIKNLSNVPTYYFIVKMIYNYYNVHFIRVKKVMSLFRQLPTCYKWVYDYNLHTSHIKILDKTLCSCPFNNLLILS